jgi:hypothetical protein
MMGWLTWLAFHIHKRIFSQNRSLKKREEALLMAASFLNEGKATGVDDHPRGRLCCPQKAKAAEKSPTGKR